jgi:hypothetical protein
MSGLRSPGTGQCPPQPSKSICFRIKAIPLDWNKGRLLDALETVEPSIQDILQDIQLYPSCGGGRQSQTALLIIETETCAEYFSNIGPKESRYINFVDERGRRGSLELDRHFRGLTPLNAPEEAVAELVNYHY